MYRQISFKTGRIFLHTIFIFILILGTACNDVEILDNSTPQKTLVKANDFRSNATSEFLSQVARQNINLNKQDLILIQDLTRVEPTGEWTPGPQNNSRANLNQHFLKHGHDFKPPFRTEQEYLASAISFVKNNNLGNKYYLDLNPYKEEKIISVVKWNSQSKEFTVTRLNGQIATYFLSNKLRVDRYIYIPDEMR